MKESPLRISFILLILFGFCLPLSLLSQNTSGNQEADVILNKVINKFKKSSGTEISFSLKGGGGSGVGTLKMQGKKFMIANSAVSTWYDGKNMWVYNSSTRETTVTTPQSSDLAEINPIYYLNAASKFNVKLSPASTNNNKTLILTPKTKRIGVKKVIIDVNTRTYTAVAIKVTTLSGQQISVTISHTNMGKKFAASEFTFPKNKYPGVKLIDLR